MLEDSNQLLPQLPIQIPLQINRHNKVTISRKCSIFVLIYNIMYGNLLVNKKIQFSMQLKCLHITHCHFSLISNEAVFSQKGK